MSPRGFRWPEGHEGLIFGRLLIEELLLEGSRLGHESGRPLAAQEGAGPLVLVAKVPVNELAKVGVR